MGVRQNIYRIYKLKASEIAKSASLDLGRLPYQKALQSHEVVSIGDNMVFEELRLIKGGQKSPEEMYKLIWGMRRGLAKHRAAGRKKEARIVASAIDSILFVPEIVDVIVDGPKSDFDKFRVKGFSVNGAHYEYLCSGSGQIRRNTTTFVDSTYRERMVKALNCGLDEKTKDFVLAKYTAYFALSFSSVLWVREPRVCVIRDFARIVPHQPVDFVDRDADGKLSLRRTEMDIELNCADGQGLIDPDFASLWAKDMGVGFKPCTFIARTCFVKGDLVTFDFKAYAAEHGITEITDRWGDKHNLCDIDVLLSESQFKTNKYYDSWADYESYAHRYGIKWGVARYSKEKDPEYVQANYQYLQALSLSQQDVDGLTKPTVDWIKGICSGETLPALVFMLGSQDKTLTPEHLYEAQASAAKTPAMKCVAKDPIFLKDDYVKKRIYKAIKGIIKKAKLGKIWVRGNYQFCISDPVAQCQSALGLDPIGVVPANAIWSDFWRQRMEDDMGSASAHIVDICRSPLIDVHEHNPSQVMIGNADADKWFSHLYSGIVFSSYDTAMARMEDADFDGDIVLQTDNQYFIKGSHKDHPIITYEKGKPTPQTMTISHVTRTAEKGFGSGVGGFSNTATCLYAMAASFKEGDPRREKIMTRIKLLRQIVGQEIDRIKGADRPKLPSDWRKTETLTGNETLDEKKAIFDHNSMVISKKPYFFRYLYPALDTRWRKYEKAYDQVARAQFGKGMGDLLRAKSLSPDELNLVRRYRKYAPLITSDCTMNRICRTFERQDFTIRFAQPEAGKPKFSALPDFPATYPSEGERPAKLAEAYRVYKRRRRKKAIESVFSGMSVPESAAQAYRDAVILASDADMDEAREMVSALHMDPWELCTYCHRMAEADPSFDWSFAWDMIGDEMPQWTFAHEPECAIREAGGDSIILGQGYSLAECSDPTERLLDRIAERALKEGSHGHDD